MANPCRVLTFFNLVLNLCCRCTAAFPLGEQSEQKSFPSSRKNGSATKYESGCGSAVSNDSPFPEMTCRCQSGEFADAARESHRMSDLMAKPPNEIASRLQWKESGIGGRMTSTVIAITLGKAHAAILRIRAVCGTPLQQSSGRTVCLREYRWCLPGLALRRH